MYAIAFAYKVPGRKCRSRDYEAKLDPFYRLCYAKKDLLAYGEQHYWPGAVSQTIDTAILDYFQK